MVGTGVGVVGVDVEAGGGLSAGVEGNGLRVGVVGMVMVGMLVMGAALRSVGHLIEVSSAGAETPAGWVGLHSW